MRAGAGIGIGGLLILGLLTLVTGRNFLSLAPLLESSGPVTQQEESGPIQSTPEEDRRVQFVSFVLDDAQDTWRKKLGDRYQDTKLVLFRDAVQTGCGYGQAATGPFHRPVLLSARSEGLHRPELLRRAAVALRRHRRVRPSLRARARDRSSRAAPPRHRAPGAPCHAAASRSAE